MKPEGMSEFSFIDQNEFHALSKCDKWRTARDAQDQRDSLASKLAVAVEALRWYADDENYDEGSSFLRGMSKVQDDKGWRADAALKRIEGGDEWDGTFRDGCDETKDHR